MKLEEFKERVKDYQLLEPGNLRKNSVEDYAETVAKKYLQLKNKEWLADEYELDIKSFVRDLGGKITCVEADEFSGWNGSIYIHKLSDFDIILPSYTSVLRDKFTLAHEMGHYFLHFNSSDEKKMAARMGTGQIEWEANWFAARLLMPKSLIEEKHLDTTFAIASYFGVSLQAADIRRESLSD